MLKANNFREYFFRKLHERFCSKDKVYNLLYSNFDTPFDISEIAKGMGLHSERISDPDDISAAVGRAVATGKASVLDIVIDGSL